MSDTRPSGQPSPAMQDLPGGIGTHGKRREFGGMGEALAPADGDRGAQTQRSPHPFRIGDRMPDEVQRAYDAVQKACALVNALDGRDTQWEVTAIVRAADQTSAGKPDGSSLRMSGSPGRARSPA